MPHISHRRIKHFTRYQATFCNLLTQPNTKKGEKLIPEALYFSGFFFYS